MTIWLNGKYVSKDDAKISVYDHGLLYGDGVFEGIRSYGGKIFRLKAHMDRLFDGAKSLMLNIPKTKEKLSALLIEAVGKETAAGNPNSYIRLVVTRGEGPLGLDPFTCETPGLFIIVDSIKLYPSEYYEKGVPIVTSAFRRVPTDTLDPRIKSLNYLNNILAKIQARQAGAQEALILNHRGYVAECTADNIIVVKNGKLRIPAGHYGSLEGITVKAVGEIARDLGYPWEEAALTLHDVYIADEVLMTGTGAEVVPVSSLDGRQFEVGPVFRKLSGEFHRRLKEDKVWCEGPKA